VNPANNNLNNKKILMKKITTCLLTTIFFFMVASAQLQTGENIAVTNTDAGKVRGYIHNSIYTYKGIPYA
jgi:para-nitrobenzyl esterase